MIIPTIENSRKQLQYYSYPQAPSFATDKTPHGPTLLTHLQPRSSNGSELYSCLASGSRDRCCAGNILVESSSPQPQDTGAVQPTHLRFGLKSVRIMFNNVGILLVQLLRYTTIHV